MSPRAIAAVALVAVAAGSRAEPAPAPDCPHCHKAKGSEVARSVATYSAPAVKLVDQHGKAVDLRALLATPRPVALNFIFTSCRTICPVLTESLASLRREVGPGVELVSISIDPEFDTPRVLEEYAKRFEVGAGWTLLTGKPDAIAVVRSAFDAASRGKDDHKPLTFLQPAGSDRWVRLDGFPSTSELVASLRPEAVRPHP